VKLKVREEASGDLSARQAIYLTRVGVLLFTQRIDGPRFHAVANWARKEALRLCPDPVPNDPRMFLSVLPGPEMPPRPSKFSGWLSEWLALRNGAYSNAITRALYGYDDVD